MGDLTDLQRGELDGTSRVFCLAFLRVFFYYRAAFLVFVASKVAFLSFLLAFSIGRSIECI